jgi:hypothetical protein
MYYQYVDFILRVVARDAKSTVDVGTAGCPYIEWFDWIPDRTSIDLDVCCESETVKGVTGDILEMDFAERFDVGTCLQVLEHIPDPAPFRARLQEICRILVVSVPYEWPEGRTAGHIHDPVTTEKLASWMERQPNEMVVVPEPFHRTRNRRLIAIYDPDPTRKYYASDIDRRVRASCNGGRRRPRAHRPAALVWCGPGGWLFGSPLRTPFTENLVRSILA